MSDTLTPMPEGVIQIPFRTKATPGDIEEQKRAEAAKAPTSPEPQPSSEAGQIIPVNADGTPKPQPQKQIQFKRFKNGMVFGFSQNPKKPGTFIIHDATGTPYAIALHPSVADMICQAVTLLFAIREEKAKEQAAQLDTLTDASDAAPAETTEGTDPTDPTTKPE